VGFLKRLSGLFRASSPESKDISYLFNVQCDRCGEIIQARVNLRDDLSAHYDEEGNATHYFCRKVLIGKERCFRPIEVLMTFDAQRCLTDQKINGGHFIVE